MFISQSRHTELVRVLTEQYESRLSELQNQISDLRRLVFMPNPTRAETLPVREANAVLDGHEVLPMADEETEERVREINRLISGDYDNSDAMWEPLQ